MVCCSVAVITSTGFLKVDGSWELECLVVVYQYEQLSRLYIRLFERQCAVIPVYGRRDGQESVLAVRGVYPFCLDKGVLREWFRPLLWVFGVYYDEGVFIQGARSKDELD